MQVTDFYSSLWQQYTHVTPQAAKIQALFQARGEQVLNDHVAFRTFNNSPISLAVLEQQLFALGYQAYGAFRFENKHLKARCYKHSEQETAPKIFLSELLVEELSSDSQTIINKLVKQIPADAVQSPAIFWAGKLWDTPSNEDYKTLSEESEYAAWLATMGLQANHFTVSVNHLTGFSCLEDVNQLLLDEGYQLNQVGGLIKGSPEAYLEQSSTMADKIEYQFSCGTQSTIPSCFYEFALRHKQTNGQLFDSFIEGNADKIFDSTNVN
ncbi:2-oxoadipate dioxygenase/decarboxylase family protein [Marinomonas epiphytica]